MTLPSDLPALFRSAGLEVVVVDGWLGRKRPGSFGPVGVNNHHTGASAKGWTRAKELLYAKWMFLTGRPDLPAPLVQIALGRSGVVYIGAAGRANHAGVAKASGSVSAGDGNALYYGIEWMLSGTEDIPAEMMAAGITLNAVLTEKVTGTSVQAISCHYNTSVTGKWDIGDPNGVLFRGIRVLDIVKFRLAVAERRKSLYPKVPPVAPVKPPVPGKTVDLLAGHFSCQFSDTNGQWKHDADRVFSRGYEWITGTEAGESRTWKVLSASARKHGYKIVRFRSNWTAVRKDIVARGSWKKPVGVVTAKAAQTAGNGHDTSILSVEFKHVTPGVGTISIFSSHYPNRGRPDSKDPAYKVNLRWTRRNARVLGDRMEAAAKGPGLAFYGGDQNIVDKHDDTFFGEPIISCWDELKRYPNTGHGNIDVIARYEGDNRARCVNARAFDDKALFLYADHFLIQAKYRVTLR